MRYVLFVLLHFFVTFFAKGQNNTFPASGNVGIGTTSPAGKLDINQAGAQLRLSGGTIAGGVWTSATEHLYLADWNTGTKGLLVNMSSGNVGIGTTSPDYLLQIHSSNNPTLSVGKGNSNTSGQSSLLFNAGDGSAFNGFWMRYFKTTATDRFGFIDGGGLERLSILNGGNVGIGTTSPEGLLHIGTSNLGVGTAKRLLLEPPYHTGAAWQFTVRDDTGSSYLGIGYGAESLTMHHGGNLGNGTTNPQQKLHVKGTVYSTEVKVDLAAGTGPDYVFEPSYDLKPLSEIETYIKENKHLPEVPSAKEMEANGVQLGEMNMLLLKKVEELTLYVIEQNKTILEQGKRIASFEEKSKN